MALTAPTDRSVNTHTQSTKSRQPLAASARPFQGSIMGITTTGYLRPLTAGDVLMAISERTLDLVDVVASDGGQNHTVDRGLMGVIVPVAGVARADVGKRRQVYASDDATFTFLAPGNTLVGPVVGIDSTGFAVVQFTPHHFVQAGPGTLGLRDLTDAPATLTTADLDKTIRQNNTAARTITLPAAADCVGRFITVVKNGTAAFAITIQANGAELIDGSNTIALSASAVRDRMTLQSDGTGWTRVS